MTSGGFFDSHCRAWSALWQVVRPPLCPSFSLSVMLVSLII